MCPVFTGSERGLPEQRLDDADGGAALQQVGRKAVPQCMDRPPACLGQRPRTPNGRPRAEHGRTDRMLARPCSERPAVGSSIPGSTIPRQAKRRRRSCDLRPLAIEGDRQPRQRKILARHGLDEAERPAPAVAPTPSAREWIGAQGDAGRSQRLQPVPTSVAG